jgi:hypothetical protein
MTTGQLESVLREYVFGFIAEDTARVINRAYVGPSENVLCAIGLLTYTEFLGWLDRRASGTPELKRGENRACFEQFFRGMGPAYAALIDSGYDVWKRFRNSLVHEYAIREDIDVALPGRISACGIERDASTGRYGIWCGRYFEDLYAASALMYLRYTGKSAPPQPLLGIPQ